MCSGYESLKMLIVLDIGWFLMSHDSNNMSLDDIETIASHN